MKGEGESCILCACTTISAHYLHRSLSPLFALRACLRLPLQYKNVRPDYVKAIWEIVNWKDVEARFEAATK